MGQESSSLVDESTPTIALKSRSLEAIAEYIKEGKARRVVLMVKEIRLGTQSQASRTGAGISTSAGIPDFRSPDTGLYANLERLELPYPEAVFDISFFKQNPLPFYTLARELYPGKYRPTIAHSFIDLLDQKNMLLKCFTQNIDCLEREAGLPGDKIIEAHGSFAKQRCIECKTEYPDDLMKERVSKMEVPHCNTPQCNGLVKPDIVFFGEALPSEFFESRSLPTRADLCIVMGTSLTVQPFSSLPLFVPEGVPRLLINKERVGDLGSRPDDVLLLGDIDQGVRKLAVACGWEEELSEKWKKTQPKSAFEIMDKPERTKDEKLSDEIEKLTGEIDESLKLSQDHTDSTLRRLEKTRQQVREDVLSTDDSVPHVDAKADDKLGLPHGSSHLRESGENATKKIGSDSEKEGDEKL